MKTNILSYEPIHQKLFDEYREAIVAKTLMPGARIHSLSEIQKKHRVSRETAKLVLRRLKAQGYIVQRRGKGSFVAGVDKRRKAWLVVLPFYSAQYEELLQQLARKAAEAGRELSHILDHNRWDEEIRVVGSAIREGYEAVIVIPTLDEARTAPFYARLSPGETFVALIDHTLTGSYFPYVIQSYDLGIQRGMQHLIDLGCRRIALVKNSLWSRDNRLQNLIEETFGEIAAGLGSKDALVFEGPSNFSREQIDSRRIDGIFCLDDADAIRLIGRLRAEGIRFPEDIRLVSYGNTELARYFTPAITSVDPHNEAMALQAAEILARHLRGEDTKLLQFVVQPDIVVRTT